MKIHDKAKVAISLFTDIPQEGKKYWLTRENKEEIEAEFAREFIKTCADEYLDFLHSKLDV